MTGNRHDTILAGVRRVLAERFIIPPESVTRETTALDVDGWDSISHVHVMLEIERRFGVTIRDDRVFDLDSVGDLVDLLLDVGAEGGGSGA